MERDEKIEEEDDKEEKEFRQVAKAEISQMTILEAIGEVSDEMEMEISLASSDAG